jgi:hypothetical protein
MSPKGNLRTSISIGISRGILEKIVRDEVHMSGWWLAIGNFVVDEEDSLRQCAFNKGRVATLSSGVSCRVQQDIR